jgi:hypothetical protein
MFKHFTPSKITRRPWTHAALLLPLVLAALHAHAADYLPDLLRDPAYLASWNKLVASEEHSESWLKLYSRSLNGVSIPSTRVALSDGTYTKDTREDTVFGAPNDERLAAIRKYIREGR